MNRRSFLSAIFAVPLAAVLPKPKFAWDKLNVPVAIDWGSAKPIVAWIHPAQHDYYKALTNLVINNPSQNMYFDNITEPDGY